MPRGPEYPHLRITDFADRELVAIVVDCEITQGDYAGWVDIADVAEYINLSTPKPLQSIGLRFSFLRRNGMMERHEDSRVHWRLTEVGRDLAKARFNRRIEGALETITTAQALIFARAFTSNYKGAPSGVATLMRREMVHATAQRRRNER